MKIHLSGKFRDRSSYDLSCNHWKKLIQNGMNLKFPKGTEMLNEGLQTKGLFKMEHFSAGGCFKWVWLVTQMKQKVLEKSCHIEMVTRIRNISLALNDQLLPRKLKRCQEESSQHTVASCCRFMSYSNNNKSTDYWDKQQYLYFSLLSVFSSTFRISQHYWINWTTENSCGRNITDVLFCREML